MSANDKPNRRQFRDGEVLDAAEGGEIVRRYPTSIVVMAGPADCGKTTLVAGLYELFHRGPFGDYQFSGSRTLPGFERRCHLARLASGLDSPDTERTPRSEGTDLLHLRLARENGGGYSDVLFSDIYGEAFRRAADVEDDCRKFAILKRADHVAVLVDGKKAADKQERQSAFSSADALIGQCLDCGMFNRDSSVQVVVTKWDLVCGNVETERFVNGKLEWLNGRYASRVGILTSHNVSFRHANFGIAPGHGIADLLGKWTQIQFRFRTTSTNCVKQYCSEFDRCAEHSMAVEGRARKVDNADPFQCLMLGLPKTGKTTFLAALWHVLKSREVHDSLVMERREGDQEYLNQIADQWSRCVELDRTPRSGQMGVAIVLRDPRQDNLVQMSIPDMSGEIYASQWEDRNCSSEFAELVANAGGCLAFIHPGTLSRTAWIVDANAIYSGWMGGDDSTDDWGGEGQISSATPWSPKDAPTQVQMVEILQFLGELAGKRLRLALVVSAWDLVTDNISPGAWIERELPLLWQFLRTNSEKFNVVYMGVSAQGGRTSDATSLLEHSIASHRIKIVAPGIEGHDITYPIRWLMSPPEPGR